MLCDLDTVKMSTQSAASWGYYNTERNEWNINLLKNAKFPVHFLPEVTQPNVVAKNLKYSWHNIPIGVPVGSYIPFFFSYFILKYRIKFLNK